MTLTTSKQRSRLFSNVCSRTHRLAAIQRLRYRRQTDGRQPSVAYTRLLVACGVRSAKKLLNHRLSRKLLTSLLGFVYVLQTVSSLSSAVGRFRSPPSPVRRSGTRCLTSSEIRCVVLTVLSSFLRQSCSVIAYECDQRIRVFFNVMRYINPRFTYFIYLQCCRSSCGALVGNFGSYRSSADAGFNALLPTKR